MVYRATFQILKRADCTSNAERRRRKRRTVPGGYERVLKEGDGRGGLEEYQRTGRRKGESLERGRRQRQEGDGR